MLLKMLHCFASGGLPPSCVCKQVPGNVIDIQEVEEERYLAAALFGLASTAQGTGIITSGCNGDALRGKAQACAAPSASSMGPTSRHSPLVVETACAVHCSTVHLALHNSREGAAHHRWLLCGPGCMSDGMLA